MPFCACMNTPLPQAIADYFRASNAADPAGAASAFTEDAVVTDEQHEYRGVAEIKAWCQGSHEKYRPKAEVTDVDHTGDKIAVTAMVSGSFPGSPLPLRFTFTLEAEKIRTLLIDA